MTCNCSSFSKTCRDAGRPRRAPRLARADRAVGRPKRAGCTRRCAADGAAVGRRTRTHRRRGCLRPAEAQRAAFWLVRHSVSEANKKGGMGLTTDCAVPVSAVPRFIEQATAAAKRVLPRPASSSSPTCGDGNVHFIPVPDAGRVEQRSTISDSARRSRSSGPSTTSPTRLGGTFSAEHGIGRVNARRNGWRTSLKWNCS